MGDVAQSFPVMGRAADRAHSLLAHEVTSAPQVNIRAKQRASFKQVSEKKTPVREDKQAMGSVYHDSRMTPAVAQRSRKQFKFNEPGMCTGNGTQRPSLRSEEQEAVQLGYHDALCSNALVDMDLWKQTMC